jgi:hypothetical protein
MSALTRADKRTDVGPVLGQVLERAADPQQWARFERQLRSVGYCRRPVRLSGRTDAIDRETGELRTVFSSECEPDSTLLTCCGNRREAVCPSCAEVYRADAFQLVSAGLRGGKGVPGSVSGHPVVFATLTAPSFGPVHSRRLAPTGEPRRCRPRRDAPVCRHGVSMGCGELHEDDDPRLGEPLCPECFDYEHAVLWNALAPELWRLTRNRIPRELARLTGVTQKRLLARVRVSYVKVAEYQARGALHFHAVIRLDAGQPNETAELVEPPPVEFTAELLGEAIRAATRHATAPLPQPAQSPPGGEQQLTLESSRERPIAIRWGRQVDTRALEPREAASCAGYIAKYATKSTEVVGGLVYRLEERDLDNLPVRPHVRRLVECAWELATAPELRGLRLRRWAHALGFRGHCFTKSRRYSTTFTALRSARHEHQLRRDHGGEPRDPWGRPRSQARCVEQRRWSFTGMGYRTLGDAWLAELGASRIREQRRIAREELRSRPRVAPVASSLDRTRGDPRRSGAGRQQIDAKGDGDGHQSDAAG